MIAAVVHVMLLMGGDDVTPAFEARARTVAPIIVQEALRVNPPFDPVLISAMAIRESSLRQGARGKLGEVGLMQILPKSARFYCRGMDVFRPRQNVRCGLRILMYARRRCGDDPARYLSRYAGAGCGSSGYARRTLATARKVWTEL